MLVTIALLVHHSLVLSTTAPARYQDDVLARLRTDHLASIASDSIVKDFRDIDGGNNSEKQSNLDRIENGSLMAPAIPDKEESKGPTDVGLLGAEEVQINQTLGLLNESQSSISKQIILASLKHQQSVLKFER